MDSFQGFPVVLGIFYSEFHPTQGPKVIYQVPENLTHHTTNVSATNPGLSPQTQILSHSIQSATINSSFLGNSPQELLFHQPSPVISNLNSKRMVSSGSSTSILHELINPEHQSNDNSSDSVDFDYISEYIIPKPELSNRLVVISTDKHKIIGYPVSIQHDRYQRNQLIFNLCFVFQNNANLSSYEPIVLKMARLLKGLEVDILRYHNG